uniref:TMEM101 protein family n=1 Tax=Schistocephalus solidus TaxID=70667 RepID=A0A0X3Q3I4_SCHSO
MATSVPSPDTFFDCLSPRQRTGVRCLRVTHFLLARGGLFQAICLMLWLAERAGREREPPIHPWIIYGHAFVYLVSSTGLSSRFLSRISVYALCAIQVHSAYVFLTAPGLGYQIWLRMRSALRSVAVAGASFRLLSTNQYSSASYVDRLGCGLLGLVSGLLGLLSLPFEATKMHQEAQNHEHAATLGLLNCNAFHWFVGGLFLVAFVAYTFPVMVVLPTSKIACSEFCFMWRLLFDWSKLVIGRV